MLERGEKIDDLVEKSEGLSLQSKTFYKTVSISIPMFEHIENAMHDRPLGAGVTFRAHHMILRTKLGWGWAMRGDDVIITASVPVP